MNDLEVILKALTRERGDLHQQIMQVDRIIKRVKSGTYQDDNIQESPKQLTVAVAPLPQPQAKPISTPLDVKLLILRIFDTIGVAAPLRQIEAEYRAITGLKQQRLREPIRTLYRAGRLKLMKDKNATRGILWVKTEWLEDGKLADNHKPEGFDLLYTAQNLFFE